MIFGKLPHPVDDRYDGRDGMDGHRHAFARCLRLFFNFPLYSCSVFRYNVIECETNGNERTDMNIEFDVYKQKLGDVEPALKGLSDSLNMEGLRNELERLQAMQEAPGFWDDPEKSQKIVVKTKQTELKIERYEKMVSNWEDLFTICEMAAEEDDDSMLEEL